MAILSDRDIRKRLDDESIQITPELTEEQIQPGSLDVRLGPSYSNEDSGGVYEDVDEIVIKPWQFYLGHTMDNVTLPNDLSAMVSGRSSWGRKGLLIHATAGWVDASFSGQVTLEIFNLSTEEIRIQPGERIGQLVFFEMSSPAEEGYNQKEDAKYNEQEGPTPSRIDEEQ